MLSNKQFKNSLKIRLCTTNSRLPFLSEFHVLIRQFISGKSENTIKCCNYCSKFMKLTIMRHVNKNQRSNLH